MIRLKEGVKTGRRGAGKGKNIFVKNNMMRDDDAVGEEIKAVVPLMVRRVTKEKTVSGARRELVWSSGGSVGIAGTAKDTKVGIAGGVPYRAK